MMTSKEIWKIFKNFFIERNHDFFPVQKVVPHDDKSLLFVSAGVVPIKKYLINGTQNEVSSRLISIQPCVRVNDLENVGVTSFHHSMFEMLGFFSIGNYYKKEATKFILDLMKELGIKQNQLYLTIHVDDKEIEDILKNSSFDMSRVIKLEGNFWDLGSGPCGPNLEVFFDKGPKYSKTDTPDVIRNDIDSKRYVEIFNVVFSQFNHVEDNYLELESKNIDSGGGFERIVAALQDVETNFETDLFTGAITHIKKNSRIKMDREIKVIVDHLRASTFMIHAGVLPGSKNRQFVLRKLIRRSVLFLLMIELDNIEDNIKTILDKLIKPISDRYKDVYENLTNITEIINAEVKVAKEGFNTQLEILKDYLIDCDNNPNGKVLFTLHESRGLDFELMQSYLSNNNIAFPIKDYQESEKKHKKVSFNKNIVSGFDTNVLVSKQKQTKFIGYDKLTHDTTVLEIIEDGEFQWLVFDKTVFYPEGGGQVSDTGIILDMKSDTSYIVLSVKKNNNVIFHKIKATSKPITSVKLQVSPDERHKVEMNHSAVHIIHQALRSILRGDTIQAGSSKNPQRLRLDFTSSTNFNRQELRKSIEKYVNDEIKKNTEVKYQIMNSIREAESNDYLLTFLEDYDKHDSLRGVIIGDSKELCVGTHVKRTKDIGAFKIKNFKTKGRNTYRIEGVTGSEAKNLKTKTQETIKAKKEKSPKLNFEDAKNSIQILEGAVELGIIDLKFNYDRKDVLDLYDKVRNKLGIFIVTFGESKKTLIMISNVETEKKFNNLINELKGKNYIIGGGRQGRFMGSLNCTVDQLTNHIKETI